MRGVALICLGVLLTGTPVLRAQTTGARIRVWPASSPTPTVGTLIRTTPDTLYLQRGIDPPRAVPRADVVRVELSRGDHRATWRGAGVGAATGAAVGGLAAFVGSDGGACGAGSFWCISVSRERAVVAGALIVGGLGGVVGLLVGSAVWSERWVQVDPAALEARVALAF